MFFLHVPNDLLSQFIFLTFSVNLLKFLITESLRSEDFLTCKREKIIVRSVKHSVHRASSGFTPDSPFLLPNSFIGWQCCLC